MNHKNQYRNDFLFHLSSPLSVCSHAMHFLCARSTNFIKTRLMTEISRITANMQRPFLLLSCIHQVR